MTAQPHSPNWYIEQLGYTQTRTVRPNGTVYRRIYDNGGVLVLDNPTHEEAIAHCEAVFDGQRFGSLKRAVQ